MIPSVPGSTPPANFFHWVWNGISNVVRSGVSTATNAVWQRTQPTVNSGPTGPVPQLTGRVEPSDTRFTIPEQLQPHNPFDLFLRTFDGAQNRFIPGGDQQLTNRPLLLGPANGSSTTGQPQQQDTGFFSSWWNTARDFRDGAGSWARGATRAAAADTVDGLATRLATLFTTHQGEITQRAREVFMNAFLAHTPVKYRQLEQHIQNFLRNPSRTDLDQIKHLLGELTTAEIHTLAPSLTDLQIEALTTLRALLDTQITEQLSIDVGAPSTFIISEDARLRLQTAEGLIHQIISDHEGVLIQTLEYLTQNISDPNGPFQALRQQINHPVNGMVPETIGLFQQGVNSQIEILQQAMNSQVEPSLRQSKDALEAYRAALRGNANLTVLLPLMRGLHEKLQLLLAGRNLVPQFTLNNWALLEQFDNGLREALNHPPEIIPSHADLLGRTDGLFSIIMDGFNKQRGMIEKAVDILFEGIGRGIQNLIGGQTGGVGASGTSGTGATTGFFNFDQLISQGGRFLNSLLASAGGALPQLGANLLATLVLQIFNMVRGHIEATHARQHALGQDTRAQQYLLDTIDPMIGDLETAIAQSSWTGLKAVLEKAFRFMREQQVYLQGLRLPINPVRHHLSSIPEFIQNINAHQNALQPLSQRVPSVVSDAMITAKAEEIKVRTSSLGPAKFILEKMCGIQTGSVLFAEIYATGSGSTPNDLSLLFRQRVFAKIDQTEPSFFAPFIKWVAKRTYDLLMPISSFYIHSTIDNSLKLVKNWITDSTTSQKSREELLVKLTRNWLAVTSGAYNQVAQTPVSQARDFVSMMQDAMKMPARNGGLKENELFAAAAKTVLGTFGPKIRCTEAIDRHFKSEIPNDSPLHFLNPLVVGLNHFCRFFLKTILFIPQWIGNQVLKGGAKIVTSRSNLFQSYSDQAIDSFCRNTPTSYAMQRIIYRQLQRVLQLLQQSLNEDVNGTGAVRNTNVTTMEITGLVEYLLEVLNKSQYRTQDRLNNYLQHHAPIRDRVEREIEDTFIPEIMETVVKTLSIALGSMTQEDEMKQMLYDTLCIANDSYENRQPVSDGDFTAIEKGIRELTDQILETSIFHAIDEKLDFTNEKQKRGVTQFLHTAQEQSRNFATQMNQLASENPSDTVTASTLMAKVSSMIECSAQYNRDRVDALGKADGNRNFHTETKHHLNEFSRKILELCTPLAGRLNQMKGIADQISSYDKLLPSLMFSVPISRTLNYRLQNQRLSSEDLGFCNTQLSALKGHIDALSRHQCPPSTLDPLQRSYQEFASALQTIQQLQKGERSLTVVYTLFAKLKQEKLNIGSSNPSDTLKQLEKQLCDNLNILPSSEQKNQLNQQVHSLMIARNTAEIETASSSFRSLHLQCMSRNSTEENDKLLLLRQTMNTLQSRLTQSIEEFSNQMATSKSEIQRACTEVANSVGTLNGRVQNQHEWPIWNLFAFDMQWLTEILKNFAFDRAKKKSKQLSESFHQPYHYDGIKNQVVLLPFIEKFGKHHLKKRG